VIVIAYCGCANAVPSDAARQSAEAALIAVEPLSPINNIAQSFASPLNSRAGRELTYITDYEQSYLYRFTYPQGVQIGYPHVKGIAEPQGECVDKANDVLIANTGAGNIVAFSHGSHLVKTLDDPGAQPVGCSVDPTTGNLAVTNMETGSGSGIG
jgi:DNA-binding beta-propeller fold protein YncE